jgi:hypothetical protein
MSVTRQWRLTPLGDNVPRKTRDPWGRNMKHGCEGRVVGGGGAEAPRGGPMRSQWGEGGKHHHAPSPHNPLRPSPSPPAHHQQARPHSAAHDKKCGRNTWPGRAATRGTVAAGGGEHAAWTAGRRSSHPPLFPTNAGNSGRCSVYAVRPLEPVTWPTPGHVHCMYRRPPFIVSGEAACRCVVAFAIVP